jgi:hypothetical protein
MTLRMVPPDTAQLGWLGSSGLIYRLFADTELVSGLLVHSTGHDPFHDAGDSEGCSAIIIAQRLDSVRSYCWTIRPQALMTLDMFVTPE